MPTLQDLNQPSHPVKPAVARRSLWFAAVLAAGFLALCARLFGDRLTLAPIVEVIVAPGLPADVAGGSGTDAAATSTRVQASGWVEADPQTFQATCRADGVVATVHAREGDLVKAGDLLALLDPTDAELERNLESHRVENARAARNAHLAAVEAARSRLALAEAEVRSASATRDEAADIDRRMRTLPAGAVAEADVTAAGLRARREEANLEASRLAVEAARADWQRLEREQAVRDAEVAEAETALATAELRLARTRIVAPRDGRIMQFPARPGGRLLLNTDDPESATVAVLYDPDHLQVRVDVALADCARLGIGSTALVQTAVFPGREMTGTVTRLAGAADIQRNTLQFKVSLRDPPPTLRPEMLCRVTFLASPVDRDGRSGAAVNPGTGSVRAWIPGEALVDGHAWVCDPVHLRVQRRAVQLSEAEREGHRAVISGVLPGEWVVVSPLSLREGQRVRVGKGAP